jgi:hypothetical protein
MASDQGVESLMVLVMRRACVMYTVELNFSDPARAEEWHAWYETYLAQLVLVPGLSTAQRFRAVAPGTPSWAYVALYRPTVSPLTIPLAYCHINRFQRSYS